MIYQQFLSVTIQQPDAIAIVSEGRAITYSELNEQIVSRSIQFKQQGVDVSSVIAISLPNSIDYVISIMAGFRLGAAILPLNVRYRDNELETYLKKSSTAFIVGDESHLARYAAIPHAAKLININEPFSKVSVDAVTAESGQTAVIMFSSGSTGGSKQVNRTYQNVMIEWAAAKQAAELSSQDVILCSVPMFHSHGFCNCIMASLLNGAELVIVTGEFNPRSVARALIDRSVTVYPSAPFMLKMLASIRHKVKPDASLLRLVYTAGANLEADIIENFKKVFDITPRQLYGSTETGAVAINAQGEGAENSVGKPFNGYSVKIINDDGEQLTAGETGEILIGTDAAAKCYEGLPEKTAEAFKDGYYYTGDLGLLDSQGFLTVNGRKKLMINVAGLKVDPTEVEEIIASIPDVEEVVVLGKPDGDYGEKVKAAIVAGSQVTEDEIKSVCAEKLAEYKIPKDFEFMSAIPKSPLGKILRKYL